jgi:hypothetical protein
LRVGAGRLGHRLRVEGPPGLRRAVGRGITLRPAGVVTATAATATPTTGSVPLVAVDINTLDDAGDGPGTRAAADPAGSADAIDADAIDADAIDADAIDAGAIDAGAADAMVDGPPGLITTDIPGDAADSGRGSRRESGAGSAGDGEQPADTEGVQDEHHQ